MFLKGKECCVFEEFVLFGGKLKVLDIYSMLKIVWFWDCERLCVLYGCVVLSCSSSMEMNLCICLRSMGECNELIFLVIEDVLERLINFILLENEDDFKND